MTKDAALAHSEKVNDFRCVLYTILLEETPDEKLKPWFREGNRYLRIFKDDPRLQVELDPQGIKIIPSEDLKSRRICCNLNLKNAGGKEDDNGFKKVTFGGR